MWMQCGRRALTTSNAQCVCAVLGQLNNLLTTALYPQLHAKLEVSPALTCTPHGSPCGRPSHPQQPLMACQGQGQP